MQLGELKSAIRQLRGGNPTVEVLIADTAIMVAVQKASLLEALDQAFPGGKTQETYLDLQDGHLVDSGTEPMPSQTDDDLFADLMDDDLGI